MKNLISVTLALLMLCIISGCIEEKQEVYLNPDASGKVIYETTTSIDFNLDLDKESSSQEDKALKEANYFLTSSKGVDAWKDVSFRIRDDGRFFFKGTAYFKKLSKLQIHGRLKLQNMETIFKETGTGGMELVFTPVKEDKGPEKKEKSKKLSKKELAGRIKAEKVEFAKQKIMMAAMFVSLRIERLFHLPGVLDEVEVFKRDARSNTITILYKGQDIRRAIDELTSSDAWWKNKVLAGDGKMEGPSVEELNEKCCSPRGR